MYPSTLAAKSNAKNFLKGNFVSAAAVSLCFAAVVCLFSFIKTLIALLFNIDDTSFTLSIEILHPIKLTGFIFTAIFILCFICLLAGPIYLGVFRWFWNLTADNVIPIGQVFYYFSKGMYRKTVIFIARLLIKVIVCVLLSFLPYILTVTVSSPQLYRLFGGTVPIFMASLAPLTIIFSIIGFVITFIYLFRFYLIVPLYCNDDNITDNEAFLLAKHFSYYTISGYFSFLLSFFGIFILCLLAIPIVYALPYFACANAIYSRFAINYAMKINSFKKI